MSDKGAMKKGSVVRLGLNGRLVYVQNVTRFVAYVISFPEQHDTSFDLDRRFLGPPCAIATSPYVDFYTVDIHSLSSRNLDFLETLTDGQTFEYRVLPGVSKLKLGGEIYKAGDIITITELQALAFGSRAVERYDPNAEVKEPITQSPPILSPDTPPPLRIEPIHSEKLGPNYLKIYEAIKQLGRPTLEEAAKATTVTTQAQAEWHINNMIRLGNLKWIN
jgi:hypothetical protein